MEREEISTSGWGSLGDDPVCAVVAPVLDEMHTELIKKHFEHFGCGCSSPDQINGRPLYHAQNEEYIVVGFHCPPPSCNGASLSLVTWFTARYKYNSSSQLWEAKYGTQYGNDALPQGWGNQSW